MYTHKNRQFAVPAKQYVSPWLWCSLYLARVDDYITWCVGQLVCQYGKMAERIEVPF